MLSNQSKDFYNFLVKYNETNTINNFEQTKKNVDFLIENPGEREDMFSLFVQCIYLNTKPENKEYMDNLFHFPDEDVELSVCPDSFIVYLIGLYSRIKIKVFSMEKTYLLIPPWMEFVSFIDDVFTVTEELDEEIRTEELDEEIRTEELDE